jgi:lipooligosaccharide transport system permease protein
MGLIMTALSPSYDFFMYYFTLAVTPMMLLSGVFFPVGQLPHAVQELTVALPLTHAVALVRPLMGGTLPHDPLLHLAVLALYAAAAFCIALVLMRRRLLK